ncbi:MAG: hypothetical protein KBG09_05500 [Syntrophobacterales bacterium]|nr:hypothetical protein [Syntrophobacterales bacterium]
MRLILFNIGLFSLLSQVLLLRELAVASYGVELIYLFALGVWLLFTATGAMLGRRRPAAPGPIAAALLSLAIILPANVAFIRAGRLLLSGVPGAYLPFYQQLLMPILALCPVGLLTGFIFPPAAALYVARGSVPGRRTLATAYGIESLGALAGGIIATLFLKWQVPVMAGALLSGAFISLNVPALIKQKRSLVLTVLALTGLFLVVLNWTSWLDRKTIGWNHPHLQESRDTPYGRITASGRSGQMAVFENDVLAFETEGVEGETFAHLTALQHPRPRRMLLLGGGMEGITEALREHSPTQLDVAELNERMIGMVLPQLPPERRQALASSPVRLFFADPRDFLRAGDAYDLILVAMPDPASGQTNRFYTREFFQACAARLGPEGVLGLRLRSAENIWPPPLRNRMAGIYRALKGVFPYVLFLPGATNVITASAAPLPEDPAPLIARWHERRPPARLARPPFLAYLFTNDRFREVRQLLETGTVTANSDLNPVSYRYTLQIWLSKFFPQMSFLEPNVRLPGLYIPLITVSLILLGGAFLLSRRRPAGRGIVLAGVAGFCGMILQNVLLLYYQIKDGVLYQDIGLLMALFMAGLGLGALLPLSRLSFTARRQGGTILAGFAAVALVILLVFFRGDGLGLPLTACLLVLSGSFTGLLFAHASLVGASGGTAFISPLYAADLAGGAAGAILGGLFLIPLAGLAVPVAVAGLLIFLSFLAVRDDEEGPAES